MRKKRLCTGMHLCSVWRPVHRKLSAGSMMGWFIRFDHTTSKVHLIRLNNNITNDHCSECLTTIESNRKLILICDSNHQHQQSTPIPTRSRHSPLMKTTVVSKVTLYSSHMILGFHLTTQDLIELFSVTEWTPFLVWWDQHRMMM